MASTAPPRRLLLLSNSTLHPTGYLEYAAHHISTFLRASGVKEVRPHQTLSTRCSSDDCDAGSVRALRPARPGRLRCQGAGGVPGVGLPTVQHSPGSGPGPGSSYCSGEPHYTACGLLGSDFSFTLVTSGYLYRRGQHVPAAGRPVRARPDRGEGVVTWSEQNYTWVLRGDTLTR